MPTGYTAGVADGTVTEFSAFALQCARAFGALIDMRDEPANAPIPDKFEPSDYHSKELAKALLQQHELKSLGIAETEDRAKAAYEAETGYYEQRVREAAAQDHRYLSMIYEVEKWQPPTLEHVELKNFMLKQLKDSRDFDSYTYTPPVPLTGSEWITEQLGKASRNIEYHTEQMLKDRERCAQRSAWVQQLKTSLKGK